MNNKVQKAIYKELQRQHDHSGITDLTIGLTEDPDVVNLYGPVDLKALAKVATKATLDDQVEFLDLNIISCSASKLEFIKATLNVFYAYLIHNTDDKVETLVNRCYAIDNFNKES